MNNKVSDKVREEWLMQAVYSIDTHIFNGELDSLNHKFQIACARVKNNKQCESVQPTDVIDLPLKDFFPTTIGIDWRITDPIDILAAITYECPRAFMGVKWGKEFWKILEKYYFEKPWNDPHPSDILREKLQEVYEELKRVVGDWPGKSVKFPPKKETKKSIRYVYFCPECGFELTANKSKMKKGYEEKAPVCVCGTRMGRAWEDAESAPDEAGNANVQN